MLQINMKLAKISQVRLQSKIQAYAERGATEGERAAATTAFKRLTFKADEVERAVSTLPRTVEEMLARKGRKRIR